MSENVLQKIFKPSARMKVWQIFILVIGVIAVSYAIGSEVGIVGAQDASFVYGGRTYTVEGSNKIIREDGREYTLKGSTWYYEGGDVTGEPSAGIVDSSGESLFYAKANNAIIQYGGQSQGTRTEAANLPVSGSEKPKYQK